VTLWWVLKTFFGCGVGVMGFGGGLRTEGVGVSWLLLEIWGGRGWKCDDGSE